MATRKTRAEGAATKTYQVLSNLEHDGVPYTPSRDAVVTIELEDDQAAPLLAAKVIQPIAEA